MKPISHLLFSRKYPISDPSSLVTEGNKLWLSDDVYIKRGIHRQRRYDYINADLGPQRPYIEIPVFKLISQEYTDTRLLSGCLLYTSPSPRDRTRARMPSSA